MTEARADAAGAVPVTAPLVDVVYRGPFQGRRITFLLDAVARLGGRTRFVWLDPSSQRGEDHDFLDDFIAARGGAVEATVLDGRTQSMPLALRALAPHRRQPAALSLAIGFTSLPYARAVRADRLVWCINGIPEERLLHHDDVRQRLIVEALWRGVQVGRTPDAAVVVSQPMARLVRQRVGDLTTFVAPTVVDRATFRPRTTDGGALTYVGSGAPWQDLPLLAEIWAEIHRLDPSRRFRVVSRDERADVLQEALPDGVVETTSASSPARVAELLGDTQLGFIVRRPHIVNEVSYPTKFGEYVSAGVGVVTTDIGWDIGTLVRETGSGLVVDVDDPPSRIAEQIVRFLADGRADSAALAQACDAAAAALDRTAYVERLGAMLGDLIS